MSNRALSLLGLARRAGKLSWHEDANLAAIRTGKASVLLLAEDAGSSTAKKYRDKCLFYNVPLILFASKNQLGQAVGTSPRTAIAVNDPGFAEKLQELLQR
ncbi:MAG: ribosomal L7Ae/L30e/S12e/Gadd45 family protein [Dethiobacter sp.]|jgi:ribosomal protein L7Ae-like RNA K-turn-binding protein|nr:ribosomal L7Ae/L30e/S12e/Gadd45 family protein [Dethiobacter sp.]